MKKNRGTYTSSTQPEQVWVETLNGPAPFPILGPVVYDSNGRGAMAIQTLHGGTTLLPVRVKRRP